MKYYVLCVLVCIKLFAAEHEAGYAANVPLIRAAIARQSDASASRALGNESARWADIQTVIRDQLGFHTDFTVAVDESLEKPAVDIKQKKLAVPLDLNDDVDLNGITPLTKYGILIAFGREEKANEPYAFITTKPRLTTRAQKGIAWSLFSPFVVTTAVGLGFLIAGLSSDDADYYKENTTTGLRCLTIGAAGTLSFGNIVLETHGVSMHFTKKSKQEEDAAYFAIEHLPADDLEAVMQDLNKKRGAIFRDIQVKSLIAAQLQKLKSEANNPA